MKDTSVVDTVVMDTVVKDTVKNDTVSFDTAYFGPVISIDSLGTVDSLPIVIDTASRL